MKILLTGHQGYIGSIMGMELQKTGFKVTGIDTGFFRESSLIPVNSKIRSIKKDIRDLTIDDFLSFDGVVHLAALSNDPLGELDPVLTKQINFEASVNLALLAREAGVKRFIYSSSCSLYGQGKDKELSEEDEFNPQTAYAESKVLAEQGIRELASDDFSPVFMRNGTVYGISPRQRFDLVVPNLVGWAFTTGKVNILSDGTPRRPLVHIRDVTEAFRAALVAPRESVHNQAFNVGRSGENYQVKGIAEIVKKIVKGSEITFGNPGIGADTRDYQVSFKKIESKLPGYKPTWKLEDGVIECFETLKRIGLTHSQFTSRLYTRLKQLEYLLKERKLLDSDLRWIN